MLLFFVISTFGTVMMGMFAPGVLTGSLLDGPRAASEVMEWGELRTARVTSRIRAEPSTSSEIRGTLSTGDSVRVEPMPGGWFRVYDAGLKPRLKAKPLGYVYGTLLDPVPDGGPVTLNAGG